jgi:transposase
MDTASIHSLTDVAALRAVAVQLADTVQAQAKLLSERQAKIDALVLEIAHLRRFRFGRRAEALPPEQHEALQEAVDTDLAAAEARLSALNAPTGEPARVPRNPPKRLPLPPELPRVDVPHRPASCTCAHCDAPLVQLGEDVSEQLDYEPGRFFVRRHVRPRYACRRCETVTQAPLPAQLIDKGLPAAGLAAQVLIAKYQDHLPLYRQSAIYARAGVPIARSTLAGWVGQLGVEVEPLVGAMRADLTAGPVLHADETPVALLDPGRGQTRRAYLWTYRSGPAAAAPIVVYDFQTSRAGCHAQAFLTGWRGVLMVDDYSGYKALFETEGRIELACWAHVRRKFYELHVANRSELADTALKTIGALYRIEHEAAAFAPAARQRHRQAHALPVLAAFERWLVAQQPRVPPQSGLGRAIGYTLKRWAALVRYTESGAYPIDNNPVENAIRPVALGRKNWLFSGSETAGRRAAAIMSVIQTAKLNGRDPYAYLKDVLTRLPTQPARRLRDLLPYSRQSDSELAA